MPVIKAVEIWYPKLDPERPNARYNKKNPTWELQLRTIDKVVKKMWEDELNLNVKAIIPDEGASYFRVNLKKRTIKADGTNAAPVDVVNGAKEQVDPKSIGNGSIANVRIYQYEYPKEDGTKGIASILMGVQLIKHIVYVPKPFDDDFEEEETEVITPAASEADEDDF